MKVTANELVNQLCNEYYFDEDIYNMKRSDIRFNEDDFYNSVVEYANSNSISIVDSDYDYCKAYSEILTGWEE